MLSCSRIIGRALKVTKHIHVNHSNQLLKYNGVITGTGQLRYKSDAKDNKTYKSSGTTIKPEECTPAFKYSKPKKPPPACEAQPNATCPPSCYQECERPDDNQKDSKGKNDKYLFPRYWKHLLATLILAGVTVYVISSTGLFKFNKREHQNGTNKKKKDPTKQGHRLRDVVKVPALSSSIPHEVPYLLIGGGTAAFSAFRSIKSRDPKAKVLVVTNEGDLPYMRPPLSKELWYNTDRATSAKLNFKQWNGTQRSVFYEPQEFYSNVSNLVQSDKGGVAVATGWKVTKLDVINKIAFLEDGYEIKYDKCLIATGASPKYLPIFESAEDAVKEKITVFRTKEDFLELEENVNNTNCKNIVIIGGGFLGSELACSLARNLRDSKKVFQVYKEKFIMAQVLPEYLSEWTTKKATMEGVNCIPSTEVEDFSFKNGRLALILTGGNTIEADQVILAVGVQANTQLAGSSSLEVHPEIGGYLVNAELEARSNVWVAGDAASFYDVKLGRRRVEHHDHAVISGRLAGENMTGAGKPYLHQSMFWSDLGPEVGYEAIGIIDSTLPTVGVFAKATETDTPLAAISTSNNTDRLSSKGNDAVVQTSNLSETKINSQLANNHERNLITNDNKENKYPGIKPVEQLIKYDDFGKGVIFYLRDDTVVGIVLWNIFNRMSIARQVLARGTKYEDLNEVAKLFTIHDN